MSIRETIERYRGAALILSVAVIATVLFLSYRTFWKQLGSVEMGQWFTTDDGATYFVDSSDPVPPFDHNGKPAVIAHMARQDSDHSLKAIYLERFTPQARAVALKIRAKSQVSADELQQLATGHEYKATGESQWRKFNNEMDLAFWARDLVNKQGCGKAGLVLPD